MRVLFLGTPDFANTILEKLIKSSHTVVGCVCQPDNLNARGKKTEICPVKQTAMQNNIQCFQFENIKKEGVSALRNLNADIFVTAAYGQILSQEIIDIAPFGVVNLHASVLPQYRGASPIQYALLNGDKTTGTTLMQTDIGMDTGDIIDINKCEITPEDDYGTLTTKLSEIGGELIIRYLDKIQKNEHIEKTPQNHALATKTRIISKDMCKIDFSKNSSEIVNFVRALSPKPTAYFMFKGEKYKVYKAREMLIDKQSENGKILYSDHKNGLIVACGENGVLLEEICAPNSKKMSSFAYLNGKSIPCGEVIN